MRGAVQIKTEGATYSLRFSMNARVLYEQTAGHTFFDGIRELESQAGEKFCDALVRRLFWAGLVGGGHDVTEDDAGDVIDEAGLGVAMAQMVEAIHGAFPDIKAAPGNAPAPSKKRTTARTR